MWRYFLARIYLSTPGFYDDTYALTLFFVGVTENHTYLFSVEIRANENMIPSADQTIIEQKSNG